MEPSAEISRPEIHAPPISPVAREKSEAAPKEDDRPRISPRLSKLIEQVDNMKAAMQSSASGKKYTPPAANPLKTKRVPYNNPNLVKTLHPPSLKRTKK